MTLRNHHPRSLRRELRRFLLIRRAKRVKFEREMAELTEFLDAIRESNGAKMLRQIYADDVE